MNLVWSQFSKVATLVTKTVQLVTKILDTRSHRLPNQISNLEHYSLLNVISLELIIRIFFCRTNKWNATARYVRTGSTVICWHMVRISLAVICVRVSIYFILFFFFWALIVFIHVQSIAVLNWSQNEIVAFEIKQKLTQNELVLWAAIFSLLKIELDFLRLENLILLKVFKSCA